MQKLLINYIFSSYNILFYLQVNLIFFLFDLKAIDFIVLSHQLNFTIPYFIFLFLLFYHLLLLLFRLQKFNFYLDQNFKLIFLRKINKKS